MTGFILWSGANHAEAQVVEPVVRGAAVPVANRADEGVVVPAAATKDADGARRRARRVCYISC